MFSGFYTISLFFLIRHLKRDSSKLSAPEFIEQQSCRLRKIIHSALCKACAGSRDLIKKLIWLLSILLDPVAFL